VVGHRTHALDSDRRVYPEHAHFVRVHRRMAWTSSGLASVALLAAALAPVEGSILGSIVLAVMVVVCCV